MRSCFHFIVSSLFFCMLSFSLCALEKEGAYLEAQLSFAHPSIKDTPFEKISPGTPISLKAKVKNVGTQRSASGEIYVRFAFLPPLDTYPKSSLFQTEKVSLPSIDPFKEVEINFETRHQWPSFFDYIREDWPMRQYEAVVIVSGQEHVIGRVAVGVTASYYQGHMDVTPKAVPSEREL